MMPMIQETLCAFENTTRNKHNETTYASIRMNLNQTRNINETQFGYDAANLTTAQMDQTRNLNETAFGFDAANLTTHMNQTR